MHFRAVKYPFANKKGLVYQRLGRWIQPGLKGWRKEALQGRTGRIGQVAGKSRKSEETTVTQASGSRTKRANALKSNQDNRARKGKWAGLKYTPAQDVSETQVPDTTAPLQGAGGMHASGV